MFQNIRLRDRGPIRRNGESLDKTVIGGTDICIMSCIGQYIAIRTAADFGQGIMLTTFVVMLKFLHLGNCSTTGGDGKGLDITIIAASGIRQDIGI